MRSAFGFSISFDYSLDSNDFFDGVTADSIAANASLQAAGAFYESLLLDDFLAISPAVAWTAPSGNRWQAQYVNPSTGSATTDDFLFVPADTIIVYVGARLLPGSQLGEGGPGGFQVAGSTQAWIDTVAERGEGAPTSGASATEMAPWGGSIALDLDSVWNFDHTVAPTITQNDLYSTLLHELGHVLGLGVRKPGLTSWDNLINFSPSPDTFTGTASVAEFGGEIDLDPNVTALDQHWDNGTMSTVYGGGPAQEAALDPSLTIGTRKLVTDLDAAGLDDIGWDIAPVPEPSSALLVGLSIGLGICRRTRRRS